MCRRGFIHARASLCLYLPACSQVKLLERRAANLRLNEPAAYRVSAIGGP